MSFIDKIRTRLDGLTWERKIHAINRIFEKIRIIHNAVGDVYAHRKTVAEFAAEHPNIYNKLSAKLAPYVSGGYLTQEGWQIFLADIFNPRHDAIVKYRGDLMAKVRSFTSTRRDDLIAAGVLVETADIIIENKANMRSTVSADEFDPLEE